MARCPTILRETNGASRPHKVGHCVRLSLLIGPFRRLGYAAYLFRGGGVHFGRKVRQTLNELNRCLKATPLSEVSSLLSG